jgi:uncharacterized protein YbjT (DUF2867 family)
LTAAWIAGATGLVGGYALQAILDRYDRVVALTRRPLTTRHPRLESAPIETLGIDGPVDDVFCALGTTIRKAGSREAFRRVDIDLPLRIADAALERGAKQYLLVSSVGADARSANFYLRVKGELEERLTGFRAVHVFRPSFLIGERAESRPGEKLGIAIAKVVQTALLGPLRIYRPIEARLVGEAMAVAAMQDGEGKHVYHYDDIVRAASANRRS